MDMNLKLKIYLEDQDGKFMGIGVLWLLQGIAKEGSLRAAAAAMDISYSKAYTMITNLENGLGKKILERKKGGQDRAGATLTPFAVEFMKLYDGFQRDCKRISQRPFAHFERKLNNLLAKTEE